MPSPPDLTRSRSPPRPFEPWPARTFPCSAWFGARHVPGTALALALRLALRPGRGPAGHGRPWADRAGGYASTVSLVDTLGRPVRDLRISVTDRCNFRCVYCMPKEVFGRDYRFLDRRELLTFEEIERLARAFVRQGVREDPAHGRRAARAARPRAPDRDAGRDRRPRPDADDERLAARAEGARRCATPASRRVTVSLDSLDDEVFRAMNDVDFPVARVLEGIDAAAAAGPRRPSRSTWSSSAASTRAASSRWHATSTAPATSCASSSTWTSATRTAGAWTTSCRRPRSSTTIDAELPLEPIEPNYPGEVARRWRYRDGGGEIGVISSVTQPFCGGCTRARLSAEGRLFTCLFAVRGHDLRAARPRRRVRRGARRRDRRASGAARTDRYSELRTAETAAEPKIEMSYIGG